MAGHITSYFCGAQTNNNGEMAKFLTVPESERYGQASIYQHLCARIIQQTWRRYCVRKSSSHRFRQGIRKVIRMNTFGRLYEDVRAGLGPRQMAAAAAESSSEHSYTSSTPSTAPEVRDAGGRLCPVFFFRACVEGERGGRVFYERLIRCYWANCALHD